jgi:hypothetical protein
MFGMSYRTRLGNDVSGDSYGYKLHLVYGCNASPSEKAYNTINDSPEAITFSWEVTTTPVPVTNYKPTSLIVVDSSVVDPAALLLLETELYGDLLLVSLIFLLRTKSLLSFGGSIRFYRKELRCSNLLF